MATTRMMKLEKLTTTVGAEVLDVDVERMRTDPDLPDAVKNALEEHGILVFRGLHVDDDTQVQFHRQLGELLQYPEAENPDVLVVSLEPDNAYAKYLEATVYWHVDDTMRAVPSKATMLSAKRLASKGGETEFAGTYAAYDDLTDEEKERFAKLRVFHSQVPIQTLVNPNPTEEQLADWRQRSHEHVWSDGDTIMWNNYGVLHRVMPYDASSHREMHRTTLVGTEPIQ